MSYPLKAGTPAARSMVVERSTRSPVPPIANKNNFFMSVIFYILASLFGFVRPWVRNGNSLIGESFKKKAEDVKEQQRIYGAS